MNKLTIYYDKECPFCSKYSELIKLRSYYDVSLFNAREHQNKMLYFSERGMDINDGFIVEISGLVLQGDQAVVFLSQDMKTKRFLGKATLFLMKNQNLMSVLYPVVKVVRIILLWVIGKSSRIEDENIIVSIMGGLGNQMFQYAFAYAFSQDKNKVLKLDISSFDIYGLRNYELELFNIDALLASEKEVKKLKYKNESIFEKVVRKARRGEKALSGKYYKEPSFKFNQKVFQVDSDIYFEGYWQSEKYFKAYREELLKKFRLRKEIHSESQKYKQKIKNTESVSLHIRRGDYVTNAHTNSIHGTCTLAYYKRSVLKIEKKNNAHFFIFSDDLDWAKENLNFIHKKTFINLDNNIPDHEEMYLMSLCKHNIIANSSFSWWGAWLNQNPEKIVIAPKEWFKVDTFDTQDLLPSDWVVT